MDWENFRNEWSEVLADTPGLEESIFLMVQALLGEQYEIAFNEGNSEGYEEGYESGYDNGRDAGYESGYTDGCEDCN